MLSSEHCLARAERLRMLMLTAPDPASAVRLRGLVQKYRILAEHSKKVRVVSAVQFAAPRALRSRGVGATSRNRKTPRATSGILGLTYDEGKEKRRRVEGSDHART